MKRKVPNFSRSVVVQSSVYVVGGEGGNQSLNSTWEFNFKSNKVTDKKNMNMKRGAMGLVYDPNQRTIYAIGGDQNGHCLTQCEKYSIKDNKWTNISQLLIAKCNVSACMFGKNYIYSIGGWAKDKTLSDVE